MTPFQLSPSPRRVPLLLRGHGLFGHVVAIIAWSFLGLAVLIGGGLSLAVDVATPLALSKGHTVASGVITGLEATNTHIGGDEDTQGTPVYAYHYSFEHERQGWTGTSYATGRVANVNDQADIQLALSDPSKSQIAGMRSGMLPTATLLVLLLTLLPLPVIGWTLRKGVHTNRLLQHGLVAPGRLVEEITPAPSANNARDFVYRFEFRDTEDRPHQVSVRTARGWRLDEGVTEPVIYDPLQPHSGLLLDTMPGHPSIGADGQLQVDRPGVAMSVLILPLVTPLALMIYGLVFFLR